MGSARYLSYIYNILTLVGFMLLTVACSDNLEQNLYPAGEEYITFDVDSQDAAYDKKLNLLKIGSARNSATFIVISNTRWKVDCKDSWCQIVYENNDSIHIGKGTFTINVTPNHTGEVRECNIIVSAIRGDNTQIYGYSSTIHIQQGRQNIQVTYDGSIIPFVGTTQNTEPIVTVTANQSWEVSCSQSWLTILPGSEMVGTTYIHTSDPNVEVSVVFRLKIDVNLGTSERRAEVLISSPDNIFAPVYLTVIQEGLTDSFIIIPSEVPAIPFNGDKIEFTVFSPRENWEVLSYPDNEWIKLDCTSGHASTDPITVKATIEFNAETKFREGLIIFKRTSETEGDQIGTRILIRQYGSPEEGNIPEENDNIPPVGN